MNNAPRTARPAISLAYRTSFLLGAVCALPEFGSARAFGIAQPIVARIEAIAPHAGGFADGYDLVADRAAIATPTFTRHLIRCFLRGSNAKVTA
ncbi:MAG: hypothetical protein ACO1OX_07710 [Novosphingobium sp.]